MVGPLNQPRSRIWLFPKRCKVLADSKRVCPLPTNYLMTPEFKSVRVVVPTLAHRLVPLNMSQILLDPKWRAGVNPLQSEIANIHPHAAYSAYTHGVSSWWTFLGRTTPNICPHFAPRHFKNKIHSRSDRPRPP